MRTTVICYRQSSVVCQPVRVGHELDASMDWIGLDCGEWMFFYVIEEPSRLSKNESCLTVAYLILLDVNSKTSVMYFKGRLMSVLDCILLVFNQRATMIQFFGYFTDSLYTGLDWMWVRIHGVIMDWIGLGH